MTPPGPRADLNVTVCVNGCACVGARGSEIHNEMHSQVHRGTGTGTGISPVLDRMCEIWSSDDVVAWREELFAKKG